QRRQNRTPLAPTEGRHSPRIDHLSLPPPPQRASPLAQRAPRPLALAPGRWSPKPRARVTAPPPLGEGGVLPHRRDAGRPRLSVGDSGQPLPRRARSPGRRFGEAAGSGAPARQSRYSRDLRPSVVARAGRQPFGQDSQGALLRVHLPLGSGTRRARLPRSAARRSRSGHPAAARGGND